MNNHNKNHLSGATNWFIPGLAIAIFVPIAIGIIACSKMDDTYDQFWKDGPKVYPASPDSVKVFPGENRIELIWLILGDPTVSKAKIYWNNKKDSIDVPVELTEKGIDTVKVSFTDMSEGSYSFDIYTYDRRGNQSVPATVVGKVYGESYSSSLLNRLVKSAEFIDGSLEIVWGNPADNTSIGDELVYTDISGTDRHVYVRSDADSTIVDDFDFNAGKTFSYRTMYLPEPTAIDTFYTGYRTIKIKGPATDIPKTGWTIVAYSSSYQNDPARAPKSAIDNNPATVWVNQTVPATDYPHFIVVDMGSVQEDIYGFSCMINAALGAPKILEVLISNDNENWTSMGDITLEYRSGIQFFDFSTTQNFRYFKVIAKKPAGSTKNVIIAEVGMFVR